jgi:tripartite-type tricarboxylate transporter receptor subunit TctC
VPTVAEFGYNGYQLDFWLGLLAPPKTSKETTSQLAVLFTAAVQASEVRAKLVTQGLYPSVSCGADFAAFLRIQVDEFTRVIREMDIKGE